MTKSVHIEHRKFVVNWAANAVWQIFKNQLFSMNFTKIPHIFGDISSENMNCPVLSVGYRIFHIILALKMTAVDWVIDIWKFGLWISSWHKMWRDSICAPYIVDRPLNINIFDGSPTIIQIEVNNLRNFKMCENLTVGRTTSHLSLGKNSLLISFFPQKL